MAEPSPPPRSTTNPDAATPPPQPAETMEAALRTFFSSPRFAVAGASSDPNKFGHQIFKWYLAHSLPVAPLNPSSASITVARAAYPALASPAALPNPAATALSVVTPPKVTAALLRDAAAAGVRAVWLQPGSFDGAALAFARGAFAAAVAGEGNVTGGEGWCVLMDGEEALGLAGREWKKVKL
ncbi:CoA binding domain-containing protein [Lineolata rhizophorae]|uniref:CoA binding domain-containing protein n=1 Tax=Lineolata rhizophorae TaxID=578093 RepID=A0A6A6NTD9_9PEZI|nr:CoA binding domain-containing protein [Lineolata rhizophorae]